MLKTDKAAFSFEDFKVPQFSYNEDNSGSGLQIGFEPIGKYNSSTGLFELTLFLTTHSDEEDEKVIFSLKSIAKFRFKPAVKFKEIPPYFYTNAIAIIFPYLRAFISTLTLQANTKLLKLGLMNLSGLEKHLKEKTIEIN